MAGVRGGERAVATGEIHQQVFLEDELIARVVRGGMHSGIHTNGVAGARFDAIAAENAAQLVDHEALRKALIAAPRITFRIFAGFDVNTLRGTRRRAAQARDATRRAVFAVREPMQAAEARRIGAALLRIGERVDTVFD